jgi:4'-phosphopantetheinyl transferase EntD
MREAWLRSDIQIRVSPQFGSRQEEHRSSIREALETMLTKLGLEGLEGVRDLSQAPRLPAGAVSISHCRLMGGWAYSASAERLGFDLELVERARPELVLRAATQAELDEAPSAVALWTAKEAAFKFLIGDKQPLTPKEIQITGWNFEDEGFYRFSAVYDGQIISGVSWAKGELVWASVC